MKKLIFILLLTISNAAFGQDYYVMVSPNVAFDTKINDPKNLLGATVEVGKYFGDVAVGINTGYFSIDKKDLYSELMVTVPIYGPFSVSVAGGWFFYKKDITMEYDINYNFPKIKGYVPVISYSLQSAFGASYKAFAIGINKDFGKKSKTK
jgi:hypothetical protein